MLNKENKRNNMTQKKKLGMLLVIALLMFVATPFEVASCERSESQELFQENGYKYHFEDGSNDTVVIASYESKSKNVKVPSSINGYQVVGIGDSAFAGEEKIESVELPEGITFIGKYAFSECYALKNVTLPNSLTSIGAAAFRKCESLDEIILPVGITAIDEEVFYYCTSLSKIEVPVGVTHIGTFAFCCCKNLTEIILPETLTFIGESAFESCEKLEEFTIPNGTEHLGDNAFRSCSKLRTITFPDSLSTITGNPFFMMFPSSTIDLVLSSEHPYYVYENDILLERETGRLIAYIKQDPYVIKNNGALSLQGDIKCICSKAFSFTSLSKVELPEGIIQIEESAFAYNSKLVSVVIPTSVTQIDEDAFIQCSDYLELSVEPGSYAEMYALENGIPFTYKK